MENIIIFKCENCGLNSKITGQNRVRKFKEKCIEWNVPYPENKFCRNCLLTQGWKSYECENCGISFKISMTVYNSRKREKNPIELCYACTDSNRVQKLRETLSVVVKKKWEENPDKMRAMHIIPLRNWLNNLTDDERKELNNKIIQGQIENDAYEKISMMSKRWWASLTDEEKEIQLLPLRKGYEKWWNITLNEEEREAFRNISAENIRRWYRTMTPEQREELSRKRKEQFWNHDPFTRARIFYAMRQGDKEKLLELQALHEEVLTYVIQDLAPDEIDFIIAS